MSTLVQVPKKRLLSRLGCRIRAAVAKWQFFPEVQNSEGSKKASKKYTKPKHRVQFLIDNGDI